MVKNNFRAYFAGTKAEFAASAKKTEADSQNLIVFIKDEANNGAGACIYALGTYFANISDVIAALSFVKGIKVGENNYVAAQGGGFVEFTSATPATVALNVTDGKVTVGLNSTFVSKVDTTAQNIATVMGDYLTSADRAALEGIIASAKSEAINEVKGNAETDTKDSRTIEGVRKYVDSKTADIASGEAFTTLKGRVDTIESDYLKSSDKTELQEGITEVGTRVTNEAPVTINESAGSGNVLKTYTFTQNGKTIGTINIAKDLVVSGGEIVEEGGVKYLELTIANQAEKVRIAVTDLVDVYTAGDYITIGSDNKISVNKAEIISGLATDENAQKYANDAKAAAISDADGKLANKADKSTTYTKTEVDDALAAKANQSTTYNKTEVDTKLGELANNISNTYTKSEVDAMFAWVEL